jgi:hypothetical protein
MKGPLWKRTASCMSTALVPTRNGVTWLHSAVSTRQSPSVLKKIISWGADINSACEPYGKAIAAAIEDGISMPFALSSMVEPIYWRSARYTTQRILLRCSHSGPWMQQRSADRRSCLTIRRSCVQSSRRSLPHLLIPHLLILPLANANNRWALHKRRRQPVSCNQKNNLDK